MANYEVNSASISTLLDWIERKEISIPEIQRPFVWKNPQVRDLIDSLYEGYPIGFIVVWKSQAIKLKDGSSSEGKQIIIDGQQRLTALCAAIKGLEVVDSHYRKQRIQIAFNPETEKFEVFNTRIAKDPKWIKDISKLFEPNFVMFNFCDTYIKSNNFEGSQIQKVTTSIQKLHDIIHNNIGQIVLSSELDIEAITEIFIRINSTGKPLSPADFVMSKLAANESFKGNQTRKIIDYFCHIMKSPEELKDIIDIVQKDNQEDQEILEIVKGFNWAVNIRPIYYPTYADLIRVSFGIKYQYGRIKTLIGLLSGNDENAHTYRIDIAERAFNNIRDAVIDFTNKDNFINYLSILNSLGFYNNKILCAQNVLNMGYALYLIQNNAHINQEQIAHNVRRWIAFSMLVSRYNSNTDAYIENDLKIFTNPNSTIDEFLDEYERVELSDIFWEEQLPEQIKNNTIKGNEYKLYLMAQIKSGARGFLSQNISVETFLTNSGEEHHIFPKNYLKNNKLISEPKEMNLIANLVYTQSEINLGISDKAPSEYISKTIDQCNGLCRLQYGGIDSLEDLMENFKENCIPENIANMEYKDFIQERSKLMSYKIREFYNSLK